MDASTFVQMAREFYGLGGDTVADQAYELIVWSDSSDLNKNALSEIGGFFKRYANEFEDRDDMLALIQDAYDEYEMGVV